MENTNMMDLSRLYWQYSSKQPVFPQQVQVKQENPENRQQFPVQSGQTPYPRLPTEAEQTSYPRVPTQSGQAPYPRVPAQSGQAPYPRLPTYEQHQQQHLSYQVTAAAYPSYQQALNYYHHTFDIFYPVMSKGKKTESSMAKRPAERQLMRPWLIERIDSGKIRGLEWVNRDDMVFRVPWKHGSRHGYSKENDACLFKLWAIHTGKFREGKDSPNPKRWKANFRCALNSLPDVKEMTTMTNKKGHDAFRVYQFQAEKQRRKGTKKALPTSENTRPKRTVPWKDNYAMKGRNDSLSSANSEAGSSYSEDDSSCQSPKSTSSRDMETKPLPRIDDWFCDRSSGTDGDLTDFDSQSDLDQAEDKDLCDKDHSYATDNQNEEAGRQKLLNSGGTVISQSQSSMETYSPGHSPVNSQIQYYQNYTDQEYEEHKNLIYANDDDMEVEQLVTEIINNGCLGSDGMGEDSTSLIDISHSTANWPQETTMMMELLNGTTDANLLVPSRQEDRADMRHFPIPKPNLAIRMSFEIGHQVHY